MRHGRWRTCWNLAGILRSRHRRTCSRSQTRRGRRRTGWTLTCVGGSESDRARDVRKPSGGAALSHFSAVRASSFPSTVDGRLFAAQVLDRKRELEAGLAIDGLGRSLGTGRSTVPSWSTWKQMDDLGSCRFHGSQSTFSVPGFPCPHDGGRVSRISHFLCVCHRRTGYSGDVRRMSRAG